METSTVPPMGRERRRKGLVNRSRRFFYGLMLLMAVPMAAASDELAAFGKYRNPTPPPAPERAELVTVDGLLMLRAGPDGGPVVSLESATARTPRQDSGLAPRFSIDTRRAADAGGTAFDLTIANLGRFRLLLKSERTAALSAWSLGGTLQAALDAGRAVATDVPVLRINDMYGSETRYLAFDTSVKQDAAGEPRLAFRWRI